MSALSEARALRKQGRPADAAALVADAVRRGALSPFELEEAGRLLTGLVDKGLVPAPSVHVRLLGQCTTSWLVPALTALSWGHRQPVQVSEGGYDQVFQDLLAMQPGDAQVIVLLPWTQRLLGDGTVDDELAFWQQCWDRVAALGAKLVQVGWDAPGDGPLGAHLGGGPTGPRGKLRAANAAVRAALPPGASFVDLEGVTARLGRQTWDPRNWFWTRQPFSEAGLVELARAMQAALRAVLTGPKKVLVLDLDNTLWGGVVGEAGPLGVQLGESPDGEAFRAFQAWCKQLTHRGVLLAVASKNEPEDARAPFEQNPGMVLRLDDFAAFEANWGPKSESMRRIAEALNLGLDSLVFFDDNPAEREQVRQAVPEVEVVEVPADPFGYIAAIEDGRWFEAVGLTAEDTQRASQYAVERQRRELAERFDSLDGYLASLEMVGRVAPVDEASLPRVVQLLGKTNQWNLTTRRHSQAVVAGMIETERAVTLTFHLADRFGDHGLVAVLLAVPDDPHTLRVDTWLMSCRVIARTAEEFLFGELVRRARALGFRRLVGEYLPTPKNKQVADVWSRMGLAAVDESGGRFEADLDALAPPATFVRPDAPPEPTGSG
jgi:FkbH-like protein